MVVSVVYVACVCCGVTNVAEPHPTITQVPIDPPKNREYINDTNKHASLEIEEVKSQTSFSLTNRLNSKHNMPHNYIHQAASNLSCNYMHEIGKETKSCREISEEKTNILFSVARFRFWFSLVLVVCFIIIHKQASI